MNSCSSNNNNIYNKLFLIKPTCGKLRPNRE